MDVTDVRNNKRLNEELRHYQMFAMNTLGGPAARHWTNEMAKLAAGAHAHQFRRAIADMQQAQQQRKESLSSAGGLPFDFKIAAPFPIQQMPIMMPADSQASCEQSTTVLEGEKVACFQIGGEKRLCLPQILNTVLKEFSLAIINQACDDLHIYCSRCNPDQLDSFKHTRILPPTAPSCGLITKTDAERLCSLLLHSQGSNVTYAVRSELGSNKPGTACLPVYHECFGEGHGYLREKLYTSPEAKCIECAECEKLFTVKQFVSHSHFNQENSVCHWGFDSSKWKYYLHFAEDRVAESEQTSLENAFNAVIEKFMQVDLRSPPKKRKSDTCEENGPSTKSGREMHSPSRSANWYGPPTFPQPVPWSATAPAPFLAPELKPRILGRNATSHLTDGPPVLANPERVVPSSESNRYEKHYVPNIALQPSASKDKLKDEAMPRSKLSSVSSYDSSLSDGETYELPVNARQDISNKLSEMHRIMLDILSKSRVEENTQKDYQEAYEALDAGVRQHVRILTEKSVSDDR